MTNSKDSDERSHRLIWVCAVCKMLFFNDRSHKCIGFFASKKCTLMFWAAMQNKSRFSQLKYSLRG